MQYPAVAVIIVSYNSVVELRCCLEALNCQTVPATQIIVIDNNSLESPQELINCQFPHVRFLRLKENFGFAKANNIGLTLVDGCSWVALLNPDAYPAVDWLEKMLQATVLFPEYTFFGSRLLLASSPDILDGVGDCYHLSGLAWRRGYGCAAAGNFMEGCEIFSPCAAAALYRLDIITEVGGFDERFFCYMEDVDLGFRLRLIGHRCRYIPEAVVHHVSSAISGSHSEFTTYHGHRNLVWTFFKNMPMPAFLFLVFPHLLLSLFSLLWLSFHGRGGVVRRAKIDAIKSLPELWQERTRIQAQRTVSCRTLLKVMSWGFSRKDGSRK